MPQAEQNGSWNRGEMRSSHGYVKVRVGVGHPLADPKGYAYEHLLVWVAAGNPKPSREQTLHHRNGCKHDNRLANLALCSRAQHSAEHVADARRDDQGRFARAPSNVGGAR